VLCLLEASAKEERVQSLEQPTNLKNISYVNKAASIV
jgi:hypothetical protein